MRSYPSSVSISSVAYGCLILAAGCLAGLFTSVVASTELKWIVVYVLGTLLLTTVALSRQPRRMALALFVFFTPLLVNKRLVSSDYLLISGGPSSFYLFLYDIPLIFLLLCFVADRITRKNARTYIPRVLPAAALYTVWTAISVLNSTEPLLTFIEFVWLCKMALIVLVLANLVSNRRDLVLVITALVAGLALQELVTYSQAYLGKWYSLTGDVEYTTLDTTARPETFRAGGTVGWHNVQAAYYALLIPLTIGIGYHLRNRMLKRFFLLIVIGGVLAVMLTYSRNGYLSLLAAVTVVLFLARRRGLIRGRHLFLGAWLALFIAVVIIALRGETVIGRIRSKAAIAPRIESMAIAFNMIGEHPFMGVGLNNFSVAMGNATYSPQGISSLQRTYVGGEFFGSAVHNKYLLVASETGIIGLLFFLWVLCVIYKSAFGLMKQPSVFYWGIGAGMLAALVGASINMLFDIYNSDLLITVFWTLVAFMYAAEKIARQETKEPPDLSRSAGPSGVPAYERSPV